MLFRVVVATILAALTGRSDVLAAHYPLEVTNIRPSMDARHRLARAYPGLEYNVRAAVIGGAYPYTHALENAPEGMTIDRLTGLISWPNPTRSASPTLLVTDSEGARVTATWSITVTTDGFRFVDAGAGRPAQGNDCVSACGTGTRDNPWRSLSDVYQAGAPSEVVYFRPGRYRVSGMPVVGAGRGWDRVEFAERVRPVIWLAERPEGTVIDFAPASSGEVSPLIRLSGPNVYVDGFETTGSRIMAFQVVSGPGTGPTFRRLRMHTHGPGLEGSNAAFIMTTTAPTPSQYGVIQDCEFWDVTGLAVTLKIYAQQKVLIEDTRHHHAPTAIELKDDVRQFTVRGNRIHDVADTAIGGNMHEATTHGEILFNYAKAAVALDLNQDGMAGVVHVYRNTFVGKIQVRNTDAADGPFHLTRNVFVSSDRGTKRLPRISLYDVKDESRILASDNLTISPGDHGVDAEGALTGPHAGQRGQRGHQR